MTDLLVRHMSLRSFIIVIRGKKWNLRIQSFIIRVCICIFVEMMTRAPYLRHGT